MVSPTSCRLDCPCSLPRARRRELAHPCAQTVAPCSRARLRRCGIATALECPLRHGHPWPGLGYRSRLSLAGNPDKSYHFGTHLEVPPCSASADSPTTLPW